MHLFLRACINKIIAWMSNVYRHGDSNTGTLYHLIFVIFGTFFDREKQNTQNIYVISCKRLQRILNFKQIFFIFTTFTIHTKKPTTNP